MTVATRRERAERPTRRDEAWRYAPHRRLAELTFGPAVAPVGIDDADLPAGVADLGVDRIVVVNGIPRSREQDASQARTSFTRTSGEGAVDAFVDANIEFAPDGVVIEVGDDEQLASPIHIVDVAATGDRSAMSSSRIDIRLGAGSEATIVEGRIGIGGSGGSNVVTTIVVGAGASLEHVIVQDLPDGAVHLGRTEIVQEAGSTVRTRSFNLGASYGRLAYHVRLDGPGASVDLSGLYFGVGEQILDQQLQVIHAAPDCISRQSFRGVLDDASTGVFNGGIDVCPGADGTDAAQSNDNLLLSNRAEVNTQPRLEILADEVACKHGATVGQLDDNAMYYLRSRGIGEDEARRLLINGFADQVIDDVSVEALRQWITARLGHDDD